MRELPSSHEAQLSADQGHAAELKAQIADLTQTIDQVIFGEELRWIGRELVMMAEDDADISDIDDFRLGYDKPDNFDLDSSFDNS